MSDCTPKISKFSKKYSQLGSTLVEAMVAIFVMSFGVLTLMIAQISSVNVSINSANQSEVTRAVQNYIEVMKAGALISLKEETDKDGNKYIYIAKNYSNFASSSCGKQLNIKLINSEIISCVITEKGEITVKWGDQNRVSDSSSNNDYTYTLKAD